MDKVLPDKSAVILQNQTKPQYWLTTLIQMNVAFQLLCLVVVNVGQLKKQCLHKSNDGETPTKSFLTCAHWAVVSWRSAGAYTESPISPSSR